MRIVALWKGWANRLRLESLTLYYAYRDPRTPWYAKFWTAVVVAYAFSPIDIIPDFIPIVGYLDDLVIIPVGMAIALKLIPQEILEESRHLARQRIDRKKPINWIAAGVVIAIWIVLTALVTSRVVRHLNR